MIHPSCGGNARVIEARPVGEQMRRRYQCVDCEIRFSTHERIDDPSYNDHLKMAIKLLEAAIKSEAV